MLVHLGADVVVDVTEVVAVLDLARMQPAVDARELIRQATGASPAAGSVRTLVVTTRGLHLSPLAAETVARRIARPRRPTGTQGGPTAGM
jgi:hypothetical protein